MIGKSWFAILAFFFLAPTLVLAQQNQSKTDEVAKSTKNVPSSGVQEIATQDSLSFRISASNCSKIVLLGGKASEHKLPAKLKLDLKQTTNRFKLIGSKEKQTYFGAIRHFPSESLAKLLAENQGLKVVFDEGDLKQSKSTVVTKFISIPKVEPGEKWNGHFATLTMSNVTIGQMREVTKNTKAYAGLLAIVQLAAENVVPGNKLPNFSKGGPTKSQPGPTAGHVR